MMIPLAPIPNNMQNKFKSKGEIAKRVAYTFNKNNKQPIQTVYKGHNISLKPISDGFVYNNASFYQMETEDFSHLEALNSNSKVFESKIMDCLITSKEPKKAHMVPSPNLYTINNVSKIDYMFDEDKSIPVSQIIDFAQNIDENSSQKRQEFKKQVKFFEHKKELFDTPVKYATKVVLMEDAIINKRIFLNIGNGGILEARKQDDLFKIYYACWCGYSILFHGNFTLLRDENGIPLKEDKNGNILNNNDKYYYSPKNKLCFDIDFSASPINPNINSFNFKRKVDLQADKKERNRLYLEERNKYGEIVSSENATIPKYSESWLKHRFPKIYHNTFKSDLKVIKDVLTRQKLDPKDLNINV